MTLLICCAAAVTATLIWYVNAKAREMKIGTLCLMYWGASLMWFVDAAAEYIETREAFFIPETADMLNDAFLGCAAVVLGLIIWLGVILIRDPHGIVHSVLQRNHG